MCIDSDLEFIYETAKSDSSDAAACRQVLISLWDDGEGDGCELLKLLTLEQQSFEAITSVLHYLYTKRVQLDMFFSTKQISAIVAVDGNNKTTKKSKPDPYSHWL